MKNLGVILFALFIAACVESRAFIHDPKSGNIIQVAPEEAIIGLIVATCEVAPRVWTDFAATGDLPQDLDDFVNFAGNDFPYDLEKRYCWIRVSESQREVVDIELSVNFPLKINGHVVGANQPGCSSRIPFQTGKNGPLQTEEQPPEDILKKLMRGEPL